MSLNIKHGEQIAKLRQLEADRSWPTFVIGLACCIGMVVGVLTAVGAAMWWVG